MKNRYGDTVEFIPLNDNEIEFKVTKPDSSPSEYWRFGWDQGYAQEDNVFCMVDPSGGPYIGKNTNMGHYDKNLEGKIVKYITKRDDKFIIIV